MALFSLLQSVTLSIINAKLLTLFWMIKSCKHKAFFENGQVSYMVTEKVMSCNNNLYTKYTLSYKATHVGHVRANSEV